MFVFRADRSKACETPLNFFIKKEKRKTLLYNKAYLLENWQCCYCFPCSFNTINQNRYEKEARYQKQGVLPTYCGNIGKRLRNDLISVKQLIHQESWHFILRSLIHYSVFNLKFITGSNAEAPERF